ncbi:MAG: DNA internalization-related competence protein ComEC/Rec2 [Thermoanaerobaculia bacterium]
MSDEIRTQPAASGFLSFALGLVLARSLTAPMGAAVALGVVALLVLATRLPARARASVLVGLVAAGLGIGTGERRATERELAALASIGEGRFVRVVVPVEDDWQALEDGRSRLIARSFRLALPDGGELAVSRRIAITTADEPPEVMTFATLEAEGFLRRSERGTYRLAVKSARLLSTRGEASRWSAALWNRRIARALREAAGDWRTASLGSALVEALVLGRHQRLPDELLESYQRGGTYHLLVFSGLQIALLAGALRWVARLAGLRRSADALLLAVAFFAPAFVGADPSVSRSSWMLGLLIFTRLWERPVNATSALFASALVRLVFCPWELDDAGFALTYAATAGILVGGRVLASLAGKPGRAGAFFFGVGAELATFPLTLLYFNRIVPVGSFSTLGAGPILTAMLVGGVIACALCAVSPDAAFVVLDVIGSSNGAVVAINRAVADDAGLSIVMPSPPGWLVAVAFAAGALAIARGRAALFPLVLAAPLVASIALGVARADAGEGEIRFLDVGQGDGILLRSGRSAILIDGGGSSRDPSFGRRVLVPLLADAGVRRLEAIVVSHPHPDHCGAIPAAMRDFEVGRVVVGRRHVAAHCVQRIMDEGLRSGVPVADAESVGSIEAGTVELHSIALGARFRRAPENNGSLVFAARVAGRSLLLTGDIEKEAETVLRYDHPDALRADILKVPHHGAANSSTRGFLDLVAPRLAIVSCGRNNTFGHPAGVVLASFDERRARIFRTDLHGTIALRIRKSRIYVHREFDTLRTSH